jgi:response regulator RpfG family c-di-GMP phosphodiesterase
MVRERPLIGGRVLSAPAMSPVAKLVRSSHERWDDRLPDGLAGEAAPLGSRAHPDLRRLQRNDRRQPYGDPVGAREAIWELRRGARAQFDPKLTEIFIERWLRHP